MHYVRLHLQPYWRDECERRRAYSLSDSANMNEWCHYQTTPRMTPKDVARVIDAVSHSLSWHSGPAGGNGESKLKKNVWIINYHAAPPHLATMFRHICFAREMAKAGYEVRIFSASWVHNTSIEIDLDGMSYKEVDYDGVRFVHVRTKSYGASWLRRAFELWRFARTLRTITGNFEPPSAVIHCAAVPFDLEIAKLVRMLGAKHIVEIADLWPASFVAFGLVRAGNPFLRVAYAAEQWLYHVADELVFTMEGGKAYITEKGWDRAPRWRVSLDKVHNINQGVDLADFKAGLTKSYHDNDLEASDVFKVVYVGSIRRANRLSVILDAAVKLDRQSDRKIVFLIYGSGDQQADLEKTCRERGIRNIVFKGRISPADVPSVLSRADLNLLQFGTTSLSKYGLSPNKLFIYFASGKPILSTIRAGYDLVERYGAGISVHGDPAAIASGVRRIAGADPKEYAGYCQGARRAATEYDYTKLAAKMIELLPRA